MNVFIADKFEQEGIDGLEKLGCKVVYRPGTKGSALTQALRESGAEILVVRSTEVSKQTLLAAENLKFVIRAGSGVDTIDVDEATRLGVRVSNCPGMNAAAVAELTIGLMVTLDRRIVDETDDLKRGVWNKKEYSKALGLKGRTLGIIGMGRIGYEVAKRARAFEMRIIYSDLFSRTDIENELGITRVAVEELLRSADFVTLHVAGGRSSFHLIGARELRMMKPTAYLLNCARGDVVDEEAVADALCEGRLAGAAFDVYAHEPGATDTKFTDPIAAAPRAYGTHHVGASTQQAQQAVAQEVVHIVDSYRNKGDFKHCVNDKEAALVSRR